MRHTCAGTRAPSMNATELACSASRATYLQAEQLSLAKSGQPSARMLMHRSELVTEHNCVPWVQQWSSGGLAPVQVRSRDVVGEEQASGDRGFAGVASGGEPIRESAHAERGFPHDAPHHRLVPVACILETPLRDTGDIAAVAMCVVPCLSCLPGATALEVVGRVGVPTLAD